MPRTASSTTSSLASSSPGWNSSSSSFERRCVEESVQASIIMIFNRSICALDQTRKLFVFLFFKKKKSIGIHSEPNKKYWNKPWKKCHLYVVLLEVVKACLFLLFFLIVVILLLLSFVVIVFLLFIILLAPLGFPCVERSTSQEK